MCFLVYSPSYHFLSFHAAGQRLLRVLSATPLRLSALPLALCRVSATKKGLQILMHPASPIIGLTKKFRSRPSRGTSLDGLQALSGLDRSGDFVLTPVDSDVAHAGDGEMSCAASDGGSEESGENVDEGGVAGSAAAATGGSKRVAKLARGLSQGFRRMKKRPMGASEAMTIGRASLMGDSFNDSGHVRADEYHGDGTRSYAEGWGNRASSPEPGTRYDTIRGRNRLRIIRLTLAFAMGWGMAGFRWGFLPYKPGVSCLDCAHVLPWVASYAGRPHLRAFPNVERKIPLTPGLGSCLLYRSNQMGLS